MRKLQDKPTVPKGRSLWAMVVILLASNLLASFMQSIMNIALDQIATDFSVRLSEANWVVLIYAIVSGTVITMAASLLKRFGLRKIMLFGYITALVGSFLGFIAWNFPILVVARIIQAITTGLCFPLINEALLTLSPEGKAGILLSINSGAIGFGLAFAPLISGSLITYFGLRTLFLVPGIMAALLLIVGPFILKDIYSREKRPIDILSVILSLIGLGSLMLGLSEVTHLVVPSVIAMIIGALFIALFIWRQNKIPHPLLNLAPFKVKAFTLGEILIMLSYMASVYLSLLAPLYLEGTAGFSAFHAGCLLTVPILCYASLCFVSGPALGKHGVWPLIPLGFAILLIAYIALLFTSSALSIIGVLVCFAIGYGGIGLLYPATKSVDLEVLPKEISSNGSSIHSTLVQIAGSISSALFVGIMSSSAATLMAHGTAKAEAYAIGFSHTLYIGIGLLVIAFIISFVYVRAVRTWKANQKKDQNNQKSS